MTPEQRISQIEQWHEVIGSIVHARERGEITNTEAQAQIAVVSSQYGEHPILSLANEYRERKNLKTLPNGSTLLECKRCKRTIAISIEQEGRRKVEVRLRGQRRVSEEKPKYIEDVGGKCPKCGIGQALSEYDDFHPLMGYESYEAMMQAEGFSLSPINELSAVEQYVRSRHLHTKMIVRQDESQLRK